eukprot:TRINITY_DN1139_c0_g1_i1.p1 TRINITY_DN1139_c0_g1~~TRINITY_DN1139_c0_g1_i1.p1  ORF type:complete len:358 (-),score=100.38 TRINITY_DN1139_c0_g1_i1:196-1269(-)
MGLCASTGPGDAAEKKRNQEIEKQNQADYVKENQVQKLLLLGAGESGKSTLFKQIVDLYGKGFSDEEYLEYIPIVYTNTINSMQTLLRQGDMLNEEKGNTRVSPDLEREKRLLLELSPGAVLDKEVADAIAKLWQDQGVKNTYALRARFQLAVSADYFFNRVHEFIQTGWKPNKHDILQCRVRTTGIMETTIVYEGFQMKIVDVGGQRNERKKWIHSFEQVSAVIFVAAISEYDQMLFEDESVNRIHEALSIFEEISNSKWFTESSMILFLNKRDLFQEKIQRVPLQVCFPDYKLPNDFENGWKYIADKFLEKREDKSKDVYVQVTCATDDSNVLFVFNSVRDIVIQKALKKSGLMA